MRGGVSTGTEREEGEREMVGAEGERKRKGGEREIWRGGEKGGWRV